MGDAIDYRAVLSILGERVELPPDPSLARLEWFPNPRPATPFTVTFNCEEFTSRCPLTRQPDFGYLTIEYQPRERCLESKSLNLYLGAYRETGAFWEDLANRITDDIHAAIQPEWITVKMEMNVRGGIGMTVAAARGER